MRVIVLHSDVGSCASADERDVLDQVEAVRGALARLGHEASALPFTLDLPSMAERLRGCDLVFNLVETGWGTGRLIHLAPALLDALGIPYTGAPTEATFLTSNKLAAKRTLRAHRIRTPDWLSATEAALARPVDAGRTFIVKSVWEHASIGLSDGSVVRPASLEALREALRARRAGLGGEAFAERFVDGREFNLSLLAGRKTVRVLPPAEIDFVGYGPERLKIVDWRAKWDETAYEYHHTPRRFDFPPQDAALLRRLKRLARRCWDLFGLRGYARVDFRVDGAGTPWVLEVNSNPCLTPGSGFAAAIERAGVPYEAAVGRIVDDALRRREVAS